MDWSNVTLDELVTSLKEVDWKTPPRPLSEFFSRFSLPKTQQKLQQRFKCNVYYYRSNYAVIVLVSCIVALVRRPTALLGILGLGSGLLCLNDTFATMLSDRLLRSLRKMHPPLAQRIRATSGGHNGYGAPPGKRSVKICGVQRIAVVAVLWTVGLLLFYYRAAYLSLLLAVLVGNTIVMAHVVLKTPNLKTRLTSAREEFRAVWRGYQQPSYDAHDYNL
ncbi:hypothetical protein ABBQ38_000537 [Trebouxia sp. C0009 RCD-2024]